MMQGLLEPLAPQDARQSGTALLIARGRRLNYSTLTELSLVSGRRADIVALAVDATNHIVEIKSSVAVFRANSKRQDYRAHCDSFIARFLTPCRSKSCRTSRVSLLPIAMAPRFYASIAWQPRPAARCFCALPVRRRKSFIA